MHRDLMRLNYSIDLYEHRCFIGADGLNYKCQELKQLVVEACFFFFRGIVN